VALAGHDIVVIGGSAGGVEALRRICAGLPADLAATVFVVLHISPASRSVMPELLSRAGPLPARHPRDDEATTRGTIYVAPPDMHMLLRPGHVILRRGPLESSSRPAIDALFRSAAVAYRSRVIGVVLSGLLDDGSAGLMAIGACGGTCVVQEPDDAMWPEMPRNALSHDGVYYRATVAELPALLTRLVSEAPGEMPPIPHHLIVQAATAAKELATTTTSGTTSGARTQTGRRSSQTCPQCGGVLVEVSGPGTPSFRCPLGHVAAVEAAPVASREGELDRALQSALRMHRDRVVMFRRMQQTSEAQGFTHAAARWRTGADESAEAAQVIADAMAAMRKAVV
jgi:two-component system, chemotaxis family, protein-glutamate methylesterase/glutaminase